MTETVFRILLKQKTPLEQDADIQVRRRWTTGSVASHATAAKVRCQIVISGSIQHGCRYRRQRVAGNSALAARLSGSKEKEGKKMLIVQPDPEGAKPIIQALRNRLESA
jgi:hypothetical protein